MRRPALLALLGAGALAAAGAAMALPRSQGRDARLLGDATWAARARPAPAIALHDVSGRPFSLAAERGRVVALTFLDSRCRSLCPLVGRALARVAGSLPAGERPDVLVVSVDPAGDTPASVRLAVGRLGGPGRVTWLVGTRRQLEPVWRAYGVVVRPVAGDVEHTTVVYLIDARGDERVGALFPFSRPELAHDVRALEQSA
jgi:protein SCO1/2